MSRRMVKGTRRSPRQPVPEERRLPIRPAYIILAVLLALFALKFVQKMQDVRQLQAQETALQASDNATSAQNRQLQHAIRYYRTPQYVEQQARAVLGYTLPGNYSILTRPRHRQVVAVRAAPSRRVPPPPPSWLQWWHAFFD